MTGEVAPRPLPPLVGGGQEPAPRPPCARDFRLALGQLATVNSKSGEEEVDRVFDSSNLVFIKSMEEARGALEKDCADCLEGRGIKCPVKETPVELSSNLRELRRLSPIPERRIQKVLLRGGTSGPTPLDKALASELSSLGFKQEMPEAEPISGAATELNEVPDPRPPEVRERAVLEESRESRPSCAKYLTQFIKARNASRERWKRKNRGKPRSEWTTFKGTDSLQKYTDAVESAENVDTSECEKCLGEFCPLKNDVGPINFYEATRVEINLKDGPRVSPLPRIENILDGLSWSKLLGPPNPKDVALGIIDTLKKLANKNKRT